MSRKARKIRKRAFKYRGLGRPTSATLAGPLSGPAHAATSSWYILLTVHDHVALFVQPSSHLHNWLHRIPARKHLQLPLHATEQPQWSSIEHPWLASGESVQYGTHALVLLFNSQPHSLALGISGFLDRDCFHINAAVSSERFACWNNACCVGDIFSSDLRSCVNIIFLASFTDSDSQFLLYINTVKRSNRRMCCESIVRLVGAWVTATKVFVISG